MSVIDVGMPKRSASDRALARSLSQIAASSTPRIFASTGRYASCAIAPPPSTATRMGSVTTGPRDDPAGLDGRFSACAQVSSPGNTSAGWSVILSSAGAADRAPLAHPDPVPVAAPRRVRPATVPPRTGRLGSKNRCCEDLAIRLAQDQSDVVAAQVIRCAAGRHRERTDATGWRQRFDCHRPHRANGPRGIRPARLSAVSIATRPSATGDGVRTQIALERGIQFRAGEHGEPPELRRALAVVVVRTRNLVTDAPQVGLRRRPARPPPGSAVVPPHDA